MGINDLNQVVEVAKSFKRRYNIGKDKDLDFIVSAAKSGALELEDALDKIREYEAYYGSKISQEYDQNKANRNR